MRIVVLVALWFQPAVPLVRRIRPQDYVLLLSSCEKWIIIFINSSCWNAHSIDDIIHRLINSQYNALANIGVIDGVADKDYFSKLGFEMQTIQIRDPLCSSAYGTPLHPLYLHTLAYSLQAALTSYEDALCQMKKGGRQISDSCYFHVVFSPPYDGTESDDCRNYYKELKRHFKGLYKFSIDPEKPTQSACHVMVYGVDKDRPFEFDLDAPPGGPVMSIYTLSSFLREYRASFEPCAITPDKINLSPYSGVTGLPSFSNLQTNCNHVKQLLGYSGSYPDAICDNIAAQITGGRNLNPVPSVVNYYNLNPAPPYPYPSAPYPLYQNQYIDGGPYQSQYPFQAPVLPGYPSDGNQLGPPLEQLPVQPQQQQSAEILLPQPVQQFVAQPVQLLHDLFQAAMQPVLLPQRPFELIENPQITILEQPNVGSRSIEQPEKAGVPVPEPALVIPVIHLRQKVPEGQESNFSAKADSKEPGQQPSFLRYPMDAVVPNMFTSGKEALPPSVNEEIKTLKAEDLGKLFENSGLAANSLDVPESSRSLLTPKPDDANGKGDPSGTTETALNPKAGEKESESALQAAAGSTSVSSGSNPDPVTEKPAVGEIVATPSAGVADLSPTLTTTAATPTSPPAIITDAPPAQDEILATDIETVMKDCKFWIVLGITDDDKKNAECSKKLLSIKPKFLKNYKFGGIHSKEFNIQLFLKNKSNPIMITKDDACNLDEIVKVLEDHRSEHPGEFCQDDDVIDGERSIGDTPVTSPTTPRQPSSSYSYEFVDVAPADETVGLNKFEHKSSETPEHETLPAASEKTTRKPLKIEVIYVDNLPDNMIGSPVTSADSGVLNTITYPTSPTEPTTESPQPSQRTLLQKILNMINFTESTTSLPALLSSTEAFNITSPTLYPEPTSEHIKPPTVKRSSASKIELHKECKYQIILRRPEPESSASQDCENTLSTLVTSHDWALSVETRDTFGIFLGSAGGVREIQVPTEEDCSIENVERGVNELLKDPVNKPLCVYVRAPSRV